ncbi:unnamed protein product [Effrenium voratum]|uniref:FAD-binding PCMH-type domain-containing protein n=1 Tax=Effrenium voratum TaxID=2562239 RepID=A0AA36MLJ7_9DINO|nr:unnamed protein product [Effrenium voratum]CAJ1462031.1 unnamed protein product [Effrenium voratum]
MGCCCGRSSSEDKRTPAGWEPQQRFDPLFNAPIALILVIVLLATAGVVFFVSPIAAVIPAACALLILPLLFPSVQLRIRLGTWNWTKPTTIEEFQAAAKQDATTAGGAWGFYLGKRFVQGPAIVVAENYSGVMSYPAEDVVRVKVGITWGQLTRALWNKNSVLADRAAYDPITVGGNIRVSGHGWATEAWVVDTVVKLLAVEKGSGRLLEVKYGERDFFDVSYGDQWIILEAELRFKQNGLVKLTKWTKNLDELFGDKSERKSLLDFWQASQGAPFYLINVSAFNVNQWWANPLPDGSALIDLKSDVGSMDLLLGNERKVDEEVVSSAADIQTIVPIVFSSLVSIDNCLGGCGLRLLNVELFVEKWLDPETTTKALYPWLQSGKGLAARVTLRFRRNRGKETTALDCVVGPTCVKEDEAWNQLGEIMRGLGLTRACQHIGKQQIKSLGPIELVPFNVFWPQQVTV